MTPFHALAALVAVHAVAPVAAQPATPAVAVGYADLDLTTAAGRTRLDHRIRLAVEKACGDASSSDLKGQVELSRCRHDAIARVAAQRDDAVALARRAEPIVTASER